MTDEARIALQFKHESQEFFDGTFVATGMNCEQMFEKCEELLVALRARAAARAMATLVNKGWFHGQILSEIHSYETGDVNVQVILVDYGELNPIEPQP